MFKKIDKKVIKDVKDILTDCKYDRYEATPCFNKQRQEGIAGRGYCFGDEEHVEGKCKNCVYYIKNQY